MLSAGKGWSAVSATSAAICLRERGRCVLLALPRHRELGVGALLHLRVVGAARVVRTAPPPRGAAHVGDRLRGAGLQLAQRRAGHRGGGGGDLVLVRVLLLLLEVEVVVRAPRRRGARHRLGQVDVAGRLGEVALGLDEARLQVDDVVAELVVLRLDGLVVLVQQVVVAHLLLEFLDVAFFALAERSLCAG